jgi:hypothetical protein
LVLLHIVLTREFQRASDASVQRQLSGAMPLRPADRVALDHRGLTIGHRDKEASSRVSFHCPFDDNSQAFSGFFGEG